MRIAPKAALLLLAFMAAASAEQPYGSDLVAVTSAHPRIRLDIRYATTNNFTGRRVYPDARAFLRSATALKLAEVQDELERSNLGLKVFDAYRPLSVQKIFWAIVPDERYVADPAKGSRHNRGGAVDVTLVKLDTGDELMMPTGFDDFSERAGYAFTNLEASAIRNRTMLRETMMRHGFAPMETEWWHFDDTNWPNYPVLDIAPGSP